EAPQLVVTSLLGANIEAGTWHRLDAAGREIASGKTGWPIALFFSTIDGPKVLELLNANVGNRIAIIFVDRVLTVASIPQHIYSRAPEADSVAFNARGPEEAIQIHEALQALVAK